MRGKPSLAVNPIIVKELRSRMRGVRAFAILTVVLLLLALVSYALFRTVTLTQSYSGMPLSPLVGQVVFAGLALLELMAICFITPALTTGAISGERELQTYEMLMATPLNPASVLRGKLISALTYVFVLIFAAIPMASLVFTFGGVAPRDLLKVLAVLIVVAVTMGVLGVFMSTLFHRTGRATVLTYLLVVLLFFGTTVAYGLSGALRQQVPPRWILVPNPASALFSAIAPAANSGADVYSIVGQLSMVVGGSLGSLVNVNTGGTAVARPLYHYSLAFYGLLSLVLYLLSTRLVRPVRRWRLSRREVVGGAALCLLFAGAVVLPFVLTANRYEDRGLFGAQTIPTPEPAMVMAMPGNAWAKEIAVAPVATEAPVPTPTAASPPPPLSAGSTGEQPTSGELTDDDRAAVYAAVVRRLVTVDHTFGSRPPEFPVLFIVSTTDDSVGDPNAPQLDPQVLSEALQQAVTAAVADLHIVIQWVDSGFDVPLEQVGDRVQGGGMRITLGNLHLQDDGSLLVSGSTYLANLAAGGRTYVLKKVDGTWTITGTTGAEWIS